jgi:hypothetical protein
MRHWSCATSQDSCQLPTRATAIWPISLPGSALVLECDESTVTGLTSFPDYPVDCCFNVAAVLILFDHLGNGIVGRLGASGLWSVSCLWLILEVFVKKHLSRCFP